MDLYEAMHTTFAAREFSADALPDETLHRILDHARFAPSGGNRQGWHVIAVREQATRDALAELSEPAARRYVAERIAGENPWNSVDASRVDAAAAAATAVPAPMLEPLRRAPVVLVLAVDLKLVAALDQHLPRIGLAGGASIYPFAWNILLAARAEGFGGTFSTLAIAEEPRLRALLGLPAHVAVAALIPLGRPLRPLTRLRRNPVSSFAVRERWGGPALAVAPRPPG